MQARAGRRSLRIWCAASSTGQEPYSIAMLLKEFSAQLSGWRVEIVATDLSLGVLEKARAGIFSQFEVQRGLPIQLLVKHFRQIGRTVAAQCRHPRHGPAPPAEPDAGFFPPRQFRRDLLPQRADLFRPGHQDRRVQPAGKIAGSRRRAGAGCRGIRGRHDRRVQALSGTARAVSARIRRAACVGRAEDGCARRGSACPGRSAARRLLRRGALQSRGPVTSACVSRIGPGSAKHRFARATRCIAPGTRLTKSRAAETATYCP